MLKKLSLLATGLAVAATNSMAAVYTDQASYDAGVLAGDTQPILVNLATASADISTVFGAVVGVIVLIFGIRKVYGMITRS